MNHSLATADRNTHLKVVVVALVAAIVVVTVGIIAARVGAMDAESARIRTQSIVVKAGAPAAYTRTDAPAIR
jgi:hypothetical protein